jgi:Cu/Ag efflux pump CusA
MMTSLAFIQGLFPLVVASGASQIARRDVRTPVFGGMILASFVGVMFQRPQMASPSASAAVSEPGTEVANATKAAAE